MRTPTLRPEGLRNISMQTTENTKPKKKNSDCRIWFLLHLLVRTWPPVVCSGSHNVAVLLPCWCDIHSAQPKPSPAGRWWHHRVVCAQNGSLCVWFKGSCGQGEPHGLGELHSLWWICGVPNKLNQSLPLANAIIWTAGFIDFAKSIAIFINHL